MCALDARWAPRRRQALKAALLSRRILLIARTSNMVAAGELSYPVAAATAARRAAQVEPDSSLSGRQAEQMEARDISRRALGTGEQGGWLHAPNRARRHQRDGSGSRRGPLETARSGRLEQGNRAGEREREKGSFLRSLSQTLALSADRQISFNEL